MLTFSQITLPATDKDVMRHETAKRDLKKWQNVLASYPKSDRRHTWALNNANQAQRALATIESRIQARQRAKAWRERMAQGAESQKGAAES